MRSDFSLKIQLSYIILGSGSGSCNLVDLEVDRTTIWSNRGDYDNIISERDPPSTSYYNYIL